METVLTRQTIPRADVVGSLMRPHELREARRRHQAGELTTERLREVEDAAVVELIALQRECGLDVVTDGEARRTTFFAPLLDGLAGVARIPGRSMTWFDADGVEHRLPQPLTVVGRLALGDSIAVSEFRFARALTDATVKVTLPSPLSLLHAWTPRHSAAVYPDPRAMFADCAVLLREIIAELVALGCAYIQFDAPELTNVVDLRARRELEDVLRLSEDELLGVGCELMDDLAAGAPDARFALHVCRGNNRGLFRRSGGYEPMMAALYERTPHISTLMLEFDDERSGAFDALAGAPPDKLLVLGLVSTKDGRLEDRGRLLERIEQASRHVDLRQLALSTQCGFSSTGTSIMSAAEQRAKLALIADVAAEAWG